MPHPLLCRRSPQQRFNLSRKKSARSRGGDPSDCHLTVEDFQKLFSLDFEGASLLHRTFDSDSNGTVEWNELKAGLAVITTGSTHDKAEFMFRTWDADGNGSLDKNEVRQMMLSSITLAASMIVHSMLGPMAELMTNLSSKEAQAFQAQIDQSIQSNVDPADIEEGVEMLFAQADLNHDGGISLEEFVKHCQNPDNATAPFIDSISNIIKPLSDESGADCDIQ